MFQSKAGYIDARPPTVLSRSEASKQKRPFRLDALENIDVGQHPVNHMSPVRRPFSPARRPQPIFAAVFRLNRKLDAV